MSRRVLFDSAWNVSARWSLGGKRFVLGQALGAWESWHGSCGALRLWDTLRVVFPRTVLICVRGEVGMDKEVKVWRSESGEFDWKEMVGLW